MLGMIWVGEHDVFELDGKRSLVPVIYISVG